MAATSHAPETAAGRVGRWSLTAVAVAGFIYLFTPIVVIVAYSFNKPRGKFNIIWQEFTFDNWRDPFAAGSAHRRDGGVAAGRGASRRSWPRSSAR